MVIDWPECRRLRDAVFPANTETGRAKTTETNLGNATRTPPESSSRLQRESCDDQSTSQRSAWISEATYRTISMVSNAMYVAGTASIVSRNPVVKIILSGPADV